MVRTTAVVAPLLVLLSLPRLLVDDPGAGMALTVVALLLAALLVALVPLALLRPGMPARGWLRVVPAVYAALLLLEPLRIGAPGLPGPFPLPWLIGLSPVVLSCIALGTRRPLAAGLGCGGVLVLLVAVHAGRMPSAHLAAQGVWLAILSAGLVVGVRELRVRARSADDAGRRAQELFESSRRAAAMAAQRVRTDALLHDTVLAAFLAAAQGLGDRAVPMARSALEIVSDTQDPLAGSPGTVRFAEALASAERELAPLAGQVHLDLAAAEAIELPSPVAEAVVSAMLQAIANSVLHAGPGAVRTATAWATAGGGLRIRISDDGCGFDPQGLAPARLGVRVSIVERLQRVGASADVRSTSGRGTSVVISWQPAPPAPMPETTDGAGGADGAAGATRVTLIPRHALSGVLTALVMVAVLVATAEAAFFFQAVGPLLAAILGTAVLPSIVRGARRGSMRTRTAWSLAAVGAVICGVATLGVSPDEVDSVTISWFTCGVLAGCALVWMAGQRLPPLAATACLVVAIGVWAGPAGIIRLGLAGEVVLVIGGLMMHRALRRVTEATRVAAAAERETLARRAELDASEQERHARLRSAHRNVAPLLGRIIREGGRLDAAARAECRVVEQTLRDEIRGRLLLNDATRAAILRHRRRGAVVQVLDDGGLDDVPAAALGALLDEVAELLGPVRSRRIVIRAAQPRSRTAISLVASSPDETAAALGLDTDDDVDLWVSLPRPAASEPTASESAPASSRDA
ncbi:ATP-binding protein [Clavibacter sp. MX14-G9D]|uniref:ATP-binding protein n=1 Tax=Clavibacter sp. MX14-G9D TaxID=3064656 RepID=UPI00293EF907|nr:ATP-binding protein [Clavibacter sp. MX14-G9D]